MKYLVVASVFVLCIGVLLLGVGFVAYSPGFYDAQFEANRTLDGLAWFGVDEYGLSDARDKVIAYFWGSSNVLGIDFYTELETSHMTDARGIFIVTRILSYILTGVGLAMLIGLFILMKDNRKWLKGVLWGSAAFLGIVLLIGLVGLLSFNFAFDIFHEIFFPQGNWQFPADSAMIIMFPIEFFMTATWIIVGVGVGFAALLHLVTWGVLLKCRNNNK